MNFKKDYDGEAKAIITDAFVFTDFKPGELPDMKFFTHVAAWDTGAEHTSLSMEVILRWHLQCGTIAIPGSTNAAHIAEDYDIFDFELTPDEMQRIRSAT